MNLLLVLSFVLGVSQVTTDELQRGQQFILLAMEKQNGQIAKQNEQTQHMIKVMVELVRERNELMKSERETLADTYLRWARDLLLGLAAIVWSGSSLIRRRNGNGM
jgi:hypothetical protein